MSSVSVVTNALRLRGFRQPRDAEEILHPPVRARVGEYAYLAGIAVLALVIGTAALVFAQPEHADAGSMDMSDGSASLVQPTRTIQVEANDQMRFLPGDIEVQAGETVAFTVTNTGTLEHEFVIGDDDVQAEHATDMAGEQGDGSHDEDSAYAIELAPGETRTLIYTFDDAGQLLYGCHVPGHYEAGMAGVITVTEP